MRKIIFLFLLITQVSATDVSWPGNNAVVYIAKKTMFLFKKVTVVGMNSNIAFSKATLNNGVILTMSIPIADFKTDEPDRDEEVRKILKIEKSKFLIFRSNRIDKTDYQKLLKGESLTIEGLLAIGDKNYPVEFTGLRDGEHIIFDFETTFSNFSIEPPSVAFGAVAKAKDYLLLKARINLKDF